jgi:hypothetical protein
VLHVIESLELRIETIGHIDSIGIYVLLQIREYSGVIAMTLRILLTARLRMLQWQKYKQALTL